ncbi:MAG: helix-turn-helix transcriptional regulator [Williamsia herbipolensis]|uniref:Transcriptional regulator, contains XRE-family HTH domain n=1 Tax=Williamsia serinedens TaxID=391736 RepID=A0ABT1GVP9_9NOCA|nr:helix-turn-helix transcriptional regulator [Williamsia serinedens]MBE7161280.1 helix-turn-helix transcriptional regulator [Williamsia herbipolensis]MCP2159045.1 Transcriptional regulator, contains XRE-family HTH domain [Williamsia serinedens]
MAALLREALGDSLRRVRIEQGRTLRQVSTDARVSLGYLSEIERGQKEASSELLASICGALRVDIGDVVSDAGAAMRRIVPVDARIDPDTRVVIPAPSESGALTAA